MPCCGGMRSDHPSSCAILSLKLTPTSLRLSTWLSPTPRMTPMSFSLCARQRSLPPWLPIRS